MYILKLHHLNIGFYINVHMPTLNLYNIFALDVRPIQMLRTSFPIIKSFLHMSHSKYLYEYPPLIILVAANSRSASSNTMQASLPPSSICNGIIPAFFDMAIPVSQPPVKLFHNNKVILI